MKSYRVRTVDFGTVPSVSVVAEFRSSDSAVDFLIEKILDELRGIFARTGFPADEYLEDSAAFDIEDLVDELLDNKRPAMLNETYTTPSSRDTGRVLLTITDLEALDCLGTKIPTSVISTASGVRKEFQLIELG